MLLKYRIVSLTNLKRFILDYAYHIAEMMRVSANFPDCSGFASTITYSWLYYRYLDSPDTMKHITEVYGDVFNQQHVWLDIKYSGDIIIVDVTNFRFSEFNDWIPHAGDVEYLRNLTTAELSNYIIKYSIITKDNPAYNRYKYHYKV